MKQVKGHWGMAKEEKRWLSWKNGVEWGKIECPMEDGKEIRTYYPEGVPCFYSYSAPFVIDGEVFFYRFDHDVNSWDGELFFLGEYYEGLKCMFSEE